MKGEFLSFRSWEMELLPLFLMDYDLEPTYINIILVMDATGNWR